jgi:hypothetical protein
MLVSLTILTACNSKEDKDKISNKLTLSTEGNGQVSYYINDSIKEDFNDKEPIQQTSVTIDSNTSVTIDAKADEDWEFIMWMTPDKKEYSKDSKIELKIFEDTKLVALFEVKK